MALFMIVVPQWIIFDDFGTWVTTLGVAQVPIVFNDTKLSVPGPDFRTWETTNPDQPT